MEVENKNENIIQKVIDKSEDDFENKLTYIAAGALGISFAFIEKIVCIQNSSLKWSLIFGWILLCLTLLLNLFSHLISRRYAYKTQSELDVLNKDDIEDIESFNKKVKNRNLCIETLDFFSSAILILGIGFIVLFTSNNILNGNDKVNIDKQVLIIKNHELKL